MEQQNVIIPTTPEAAHQARLRAIFGYKAQIQRSYVRVEKQLTAQDVAQTFYLTGDGQKRLLENHIGKNDLVLFYAMKAGFNKVIDANPGGNSNSIDYSYPDVNVFNAPSPGAGQNSEATCLEAVFNGTFSMKSDTFEAINKMSLKEFRQVPRTQFDDGITQASFSGDESGFVQFVEPTIFSGQSTVTLSFEPAPGGDVALIGGAAGTSNFMFMHFLTFVVRNGAQSVTLNNLPAAIKDSIMNYGRI